MLIARTLSKIYKEDGIILVDYSGQKYICGNPDKNKPITIKFLKKNLNWKILLNPELEFPEAYMRGDIIIENGSIYIARKKIWLKYKNRFGGKVGYYQMDLNSVHEVDEIHDIELISHILKKNYARKAQIIK